MEKGDVKVGDIVFVTSDGTIDRGLLYFEAEVVDVDTYICVVKSDNLRHLSITGTCSWTYGRMYPTRDEAVKAGREICQQAISDHLDRICDLAVLSAKS